MRAATFWEKSELQLSWVSWALQPPPHACYSQVGICYRSQSPCRAYTLRPQETVIEETTAVPIIWHLETTVGIGCLGVHCLSFIYLKKH